MVGKIVDPRESATCSAQIWVDSEGLLNLRGYVGIPFAAYRKLPLRMTEGASQGRHA